VLAKQLAEVAACDVFTRADQGGQVITMALVKQRLADLRAHPDDCRCGSCAPARVVKPEGVYRIAAAWQRECNATRARALR
jgi:hypothetical protein